MSVKVDLVGGYLERKFKDLRFSGDEVLLDCPVCGDKGKYNLWFNKVKNKGCCYKCHTSFTPTSLVREIEHCSLESALKLIRGLTVVEYSNNLRGLVHSYVSREDTSEVVDDLGVIGFPDGFRPVLEGGEFPEYIRRRVGDEGHLYGIGWCEKGYYSGRVIIPLVINGRLVSFVARTMRKKCDGCGGTGECEACNWKPYRAYLYPKNCKVSKLLFNYDQAREHDTIVLTEGAFDAIRVGPCGAAVLGSSLSAAQVSLLLATKARSITLLFDPDAAGEKAATKSIERLRSFYKHIKVVRLPAGKDPDDFPRDKLWGLIDDAPTFGTKAYFKAKIEHLTR